MASILRKNKGYALLAVSLVATSFAFIQLRAGQEIAYQEEYHDPHHDTADTVQPNTEASPPIPPLKTHFRDGLNNNTNYITSWTDAGFTNEFMTYANMIYLGLVSNRVPILPPFAPGHHIDSKAGVLPFSEVFDLAPLRAIVDIQILEWSDIKSPSTEVVVESLGCWSAWATGNRAENSPRYSQFLVNYLGLDLSFTPTPYHTRRLAYQGTQGEWDLQLLFWPLAALIFPSHGYKLPDDLATPFPSPMGASIVPDTQLACFDNLYFVTASHIDDEWEQHWNPAWRFVGRHIRFAKPMQEIAEIILRKTFGVPPLEPLPPFIAVHVRHGDFDGQCWDAERPEDCFAPISVYARRVREVQDELLETKHLVIPDDRVVLTSDEGDPEFWKSVTAQGWKYVNHTAEGTSEKYGEWYVILVDIVTQGLSTGFVGTLHSTVSAVSSKRVEDWYGGATRMVRFGKLGADDHR